TFASAAEAIRLTTIVRPLTLRSLVRRSSAWTHGESPGTPITIGASSLAKVCAGQSTNLVKLYRKAALISYSLAGAAAAPAAAPAFDGAAHSTACSTIATAMV